MDRKEKRGFTLAELLIVVAIIAVLVAIAIPVFTTQLEKSRESTDMANLRSAYAAATVACLSGVGDTGVIPAKDSVYWYAPGADGSLVADAQKSTAPSLGQGTGADGKSDTSVLPKEAKDNYTTSTAAKGLAIKITFGTGVVSKIEFASNASSGT